MKLSTKNLGRSLLAGLTVMLPVVLSLQLALWLFATVEGWLKPLWQVLLPDQWYVPGLGMLGFMLLATAIGMSAKLSKVGQLWRMPGRFLERVPVLSYIYGTIKDFVDMLGGKNFSDQWVVWVTLPESGARLMGIVTKRGDNKTSRLAEVIADNEVAVYLPMSYQAGGYMVIVSEDRIERIDMAPADALRLIMSAGLGQKKL